MTLFRKYTLGVDFKKPEYDKWVETLSWWIADTMPNIKDPKERAELVLKSAMNGTKINGEGWNSIPHSFFNRVKALCGFDLAAGKGIRNPRGFSSNSEETIAPKIDLTSSMKMREAYVKDLLEKYPHLDTPVYKPKVEELAETIVKSRMISNDFIAAKGKSLELLSKIRESLHKQIGELMEFLEIAPKQRVTKNLEMKNADVGSLIARLDSYGDYWTEYERLDALRELIQLYKMLKSSRPDGTPQLNDWELWHMTRSRPFSFTCRHGETYELIAGFTPEEVEKALIQAEKVYGFGLEGIGEIKEGGLPENVQDIPEEIIPESNDSTDI